jgi:UDP-glucose 4-epimerase
VYPLEAVSLRYFNVFGPGQDPLSQYAAVVPRFITMATAGTPLTVYGDGEQRRDFTFIANVVDACLAAAAVGDVGGLVLNVATGHSVSVNELADAVGAVLGCEITREHLPARSGDIRSSWPTCRREPLGWEPRVGLEEGLRATALSLGAI